MILSCHDSVGLLRLHKKSCSMCAILGYCTAKAQRHKDFQLPGAITHWVNHLHLAFHCHPPVPCVFALAG